MLSFRDRNRKEARYEGRNEGWDESASKLAELIKNGLSLDDALQKLQEEKSLWLNHPVT
ncbi:MAG: hypothetical protein FWG64_14365 [Firmicutes bacterium]|nr:hypothetical protein [Bacillota bacterium]